MKQLKAFKFRLYPNKKQQQLIEQTFGCCRFVYNYTLANHKRLNEDMWYIVEQMAQSGQLPQNNFKGQFFDKYESVKAIKLLKVNHPFLKDVDSVALQSCLDNLSKSYDKHYKTGSIVHFKSKKNPVQSYTTKCNNNNISIVGNKVKLPKLGLVKFAKSREVNGKIKTATISRSKAHKYYVSICAEVDIEPLIDCVNEVVGIDVGISDLAITSEGVKYHNPHFLRESEKKLIKEQRKLSRKVYGSNNYRKQQLRVAKLHEKIANQRYDYIHKVSTTIIRENQTIVVESLRVKNMVKNHCLAKSISDVAWGEFYRQLEYKANWYGRTIIKADPYFASSQICSNCGYKNTEIKDLSIREWICSQCNMQHDRDVNAAINLKNLV